MITMYTARTSEIDEIDDALSEIKSQIDFTALKKYSGGILFCHVDYVESGVVAALCEVLPFNVIGMTTMATVDEHGHSLYDLTLTVLTSDDVTFEAGMTNAITRDDYAAEIDRLYTGLRGRTDSDPAVIFSFIPYMREVSGYEVVKAMDAACHGVPLWGSITNSIDLTYDNVYTICNGKALPAGVAMLFITGPVTPRFIISSLPERNITNNRAIITKSDNAVLHEINNLPVMEYLTSAGLVLTKENLTAMPLMVYYDGAEKPVALGFYTLFDNGSVLTGGEMPEGAPVAIGNIDAEGILQSAKDGLEQILTHPDRQATFILPCITRYVMLAPEQERELRLIHERLAASGKPFMVGYAGGEISPLPGAGAEHSNQFHNYTFCACIL